MIHWLPENSELSPKIREAILKYSARNVYSKNGIVYFQEDKADKFYIVLSGYVRLSYIMEDGTAILYAIVPPGQSFGELGVFDRSVYTDTASAIGSVSVLAVSAGVFHSNVPFSTELREALSSLIVDRYRTYIDVTKSLYLSNLSARLAMSLLRLVNSLGQTIDLNGKSCPYLGSMVTQSDLGAMARGTRGNVNRVLKRWEREGLILVQDRKVILLDPDELENVAIRGGDTQ
ncbi:Crp/Fnr family transcriptional regulator [Roseibium sp.]|uniref:Crp/Fnr family transcriptional regulator n=1 Tax=Roseibium sp. TaxID=1936156 RepID=UPI0032671A4C